MMIGDKKLLPVAYPLNTTWTWHANLISILSNYECTLDWILSNYINIYCCKDKRKPENLFMNFSMFPNNFKQCPWVKTQDFDRQTINLFHKDILNFFIESIKDGNYLYGIFDQHQLLGISYNGKFLHELFIFGYDCEDQIFNVGDFTFSYSGKYSYVTMPFERIKAAFENIEPHEDYLHEDKTALSLIKFTEGTNYAFDSYLVKNQLIDYLHAKEDFNYRRYGVYSKDTIYGIAVYDLLFTYIYNLIDKKEKIDIKLFHFIYIHKLYMVERIIYMQKNKWLKSSFNDLEHWFNLKEMLIILRNKCIMYNNTMKNKLITDIENILLKIKVQEKELIEKLIEKIII